MHEQMVYDWYQQYKTGLYRFALSILKDSHLAEVKELIDQMHKNSPA